MRDEVYMTMLNVRAISFLPRWTYIPLIGMRGFDYDDSPSELTSIRAWQNILLTRLFPVQRTYPKL